MYLIMTDSQPYAVLSSKLSSAGTRSTTHVCYTQKTPLLYCSRVWKFVIDNHSSSCAEGNSVGHLTLFFVVVVVARSTWCDFSQSLGLSIVTTRT